MDIDNYDDYFADLNPDGIGIGRDIFEEINVDPIDQPIIVAEDHERERPAVSASAQDEMGGSERNEGIDEITDPVFRPRRKRREYHPTLTGKHT